MPAIIVVGSGKGKGGKSMPPPEPPGKPARRGMPPPSLGDEPDGDQDQEPDADDKGITPEEVGYGSGDLCQDCANMGQDGSCERYGFPVSPDGHCLHGFEPKGGGDERGA
jgi:hypothetical protein